MRMRYSEGMDEPKENEKGGFMHRGCQTIRCATPLVRKHQGKAIVDQLNPIYLFEYLDPQ